MEDEDSSDVDDIITALKQQCPIAHIDVVNEEMVEDMKDANAILLDSNTDLSYLQYEEGHVFSEEEDGVGDHDYTNTGDIDDPDYIPVEEEEDSNGEGGYVENVVNRKKHGVNGQENNVDENYINGKRNELGQLKRKRSKQAELDNANFTVHSDLGRVVQAIVRELELRPPPVLGGTGSPPSSQRVEIGGPMSPNNYGYSGTPPGVAGFPSYRPPPLVVGQSQPAGNPNKHVIKNVFCLWSSVRSSWSPFIAFISLKRITALLMLDLLSPFSIKTIALAHSTAERGILG
ncbi:hypothetical protein J6590_089300 [Homalodisca vitripennis]|nr:hypothetical protein J6590_089300 [Homalodisca vitripennis]